MQKNNKRLVLIGASLAALAALFTMSTSGVLAGGWAITTLDAVPQNMQAGHAYRISYMIRQHGFTPLIGASPRIIVKRGGEQLSFPGSPDGTAGHYVSEVMFPSDGEWTWSVDQAPFPQIQTLGAISVRPAAAPAADIKPQPPAELALLGLVALAAAGVLLALLQVKRVARPAATTATAQMASMLTHARRSTATPSRS